MFQGIFPSEENVLYSTILTSNLLSCSPYMKTTLQNAAQSKNRNHKNNPWQYSTLVQLDMIMPIKKINTPDMEKIPSN
jgi:hypothetical protein